MATVLAELAEQIDSTRLVGAAETAPLSWAQRLGYLLEQVGADDKAGDLKAYVQGSARDLTPLLARASHTGASSSPYWKLLVNATVVPDL